MRIPDSTRCCNSRLACAISVAMQTVFRNLPLINLSDWEGAKDTGISQKTCHSTDIYERACGSMGSSFPAFVVNGDCGDTTP